MSRVWRKCANSVAGRLKIVAKLVSKHIMYQDCNTYRSTRRFHVYFSQRDLNSECSHLPKNSVVTWYIVSISMKVVWLDNCLYVILISNFALSVQPFRSRNDEVVQRGTPFQHHCWLSCEPC
jgi:hypothetical protein